MGSYKKGTYVKKEKDLTSEGEKRGVVTELELPRKGKEGVFIKGRKPSLS